MPLPESPTPPGDIAASTVHGLPPRDSRRLHQYSLATTPTQPIGEAQDPPEYPAHDHLTPDGGESTLDLADGGGRGRAYECPPSLAANAVATERTALSGCVAMCWTRGRSSGPAVASSQRTATRAASEPRPGPR